MYIVKLHYNGGSLLGLGGFSLGTLASAHSTKTCILVKGKFDTLK